MTLSMNSAHVFGVWHDRKTCWPPGGHQRVERRGKLGGVKSGANVRLGTKCDSHTTHHHTALFYTEPRALHWEGALFGAPWVFVSESYKTSCESTTVHFICLILTNQGFIVHSLFCFVDSKQQAERNNSKRHQLVSPGIDWNITMVHDFMLSLWNLFCSPEVQFHSQCTSRKLFTRDVSLHTWQ